MSEEIATILERAADRLSKPGAWGRGAARGDLPCVIDAIVDAGGSINTVYYVRDFIGADGLATWNDAPERTQEEVIAKLREAAAKARAGQ